MGIAFVVKVVSDLAGCRIGRTRRERSREDEIEGHAHIGGTLCPVGVEEIDPNVPDKRKDLVGGAYRMYEAWLGRRERLE